jgi:hypothetical protein
MRFAQTKTSMLCRSYNVRARNARPFVKERINGNKEPIMPELRR